MSRNTSNIFFKQISEMKLLERNAIVEICRKVFTLYGIKFYAGTKSYPA